MATRLRELSHKRLLLTLALLALALDIPLLCCDLSVHALDSRLFYSASEVFSTLDGQGASGRRFYFFTEAADLLLIGVYTTLLSRLSATTKRARDRWLALTPILRSHRNGGGHDPASRLSRENRGPGQSYLSGHPAKMDKPDFGFP